MFCAGAPFHQKLALFEETSNDTARGKLYSLGNTRWASITNSQYDNKRQKTQCACESKTVKLGKRLLEVAKGSSNDAQKAVVITVAAAGSGRDTAYSG